MSLKKETLEFIYFMFMIIILTIPTVYFLIQQNKRTGKRKKGTIWTGILFIALAYFYYTASMEDLDSTKNTFKEEVTTTSTTTAPTRSEYYINTTPKGYVLEKKDGAYYIDGYLLVNKTYQLDSSFVPKNTQIDITDEHCNLCIDEEAYENWLLMRNDATAIGLTIYINSGYRSYSYQEDLYNRYVDRDGKVAADTYSARAGHSEHQTALAFDLNSINSSFAATDEGKWVKENAHLYGFIIRYPEGKDHITGYKYEPWHLRYVGKELANKLYNRGNYITMEEYFGIDSKYK